MLAPLVSHQKTLTMKPKILFITPYIPYPLDSGGNQAFFNMVDYLRRSVSVSILLHPRTAGQKADVEQLKALWPDVGFFLYEPRKEEEPMPFVKHPLYYKWLLKMQASIKRKLRRQLRKMPRLAGRDAEVDLMRQKTVIPTSIFERLDSGYLNFVARTARLGFDIVQVEFYDLISLGYVLPDDVETIFVHHELRYVRNENEMALFREVTAEDRMLFHIAKGYERDALSRYKHVIALTEIDRKLLEEFLGRKERIYTSPAVVNVSQGDAGDFVPCTAGRLTFVGSESHTPNLDAVVWMCQEVIPRLRLRGEKFTFQVIGKWRSSYVRELCRLCPEMELMGYVDDLRAFLKGSIAVVPIRIGSGMRMKILDAIAARCPFVTTAKGVEGIDLENGRECLMADDPDAFADAIIRLAGDAGLQEQFVQAAAARLGELYNPEQMQERRLGIYRDILQRSDM